MLFESSLSPGALHGALGHVACSISEISPGQAQQILSCIRGRRIKHCSRFRRAACAQTRRPISRCQSYLEQAWLAVKPDQEYRVMDDEAENGAVIETRSAKRPRSDHLEPQPVNGAPQHTAVIPPGKAPAVHTKALRSVLKGGHEFRFD